MICLPFEDVVLADGIFQTARNNFEPTKVTKNKLAGNYFESNKNTKIKLAGGKPSTCML